MKKDKRKELIQKILINAKLENRSNNTYELSTWFGIDVLDYKLCKNYNEFIFENIEEFVSTIYEIRQLPNIDRKKFKELISDKCIKSTIDPNSKVGIRIIVN